MEQITISGVLDNDSEKCIDANNRPYCRFVASCPYEDKFGRTRYRHYNCICYVSGYDNLKKGDQIFLSGKFSAALLLDEKGKPYMELNIMVYQASDGYKASERKTK